MCPIFSVRWKSKCGELWFCVCVFETESSLVLLYIWMLISQITDSVPLCSHLVQICFALLLVFRCPSLVSHSPPIPPFHFLVPPSIPLSPCHNLFCCLSFSCLEMFNNGHCKSGKSNTRWKIQILPYAVFFMYLFKYVFTQYIHWRQAHWSIHACLQHLEPVHECV